MRAFKQDALRSLNVRICVANGRQRQSGLHASMMERGHRLAMLPVHSVRNWVNARPCPPSWSALAVCSPQTKSARKATSLLAVCKTRGRTGTLGATQQNIVKIIFFLLFFVFISLSMISSIVLKLQKTHLFRRRTSCDWRRAPSTLRCCGELRTEATPPELGKKITIIKLHVILCVKTTAAPKSGNFVQLGWGSETVYTTSVFMHGNRWRGVLWINDFYCIDKFPRNLSSRPQYCRVPQKWHDLR